MKIKAARGNLSLFVLGAVLVGLILSVTMKAVPLFANDGESEIASSGAEHFVTIYDGGKKITVKTGAVTVADALERAEISLNDKDVVEPALEEEIVSRDFKINIYRARPAIVVDGIRQVQIMTAVSDPKEVVRSAGIELNEEDVVKITTFEGFLETGMSTAYKVFRAKKIKFMFYGQVAEIRTQADTVADFLEERNVEPKENDWISLPMETKLKDEMSLSIYRQGKHTVTVEEEVDFGEKITYDYSRNMGYKQITKPGVKGSKAVTYEIEMKDGKEVSRAVISEIIVSPAIVSEVTVGAYPIAMNPLTKSMGRNRYTTSTGILRQETYYDLNMSVVMKNCGGGGYYSVRDDGVKVDKDGYVIVAAHLGRYPRCSVVETSLGLGKVYDTGGFAQVNPEQFDIATDWTKRDGV
ncbi:MAG: ubiquitin-like domain-containing protein [Candidatus Nomurabacteria bacterium]|jgi:uncharacterized protein YabE (DUF348 family)|nr:ubiquitin-like domain-containing protein [Candidatus Nomurabacteria bacterium]